MDLECQGEGHWAPRSYSMPNVASNSSSTSVNGSLFCAVSSSTRFNWMKSRNVQYEVYWLEIHGYVVLIVNSRPIVLSRGYMLRIDVFFIFICLIVTYRLERIVKSVLERVSYRLFYVQWLCKETIISIGVTPPTDRYTDTPSQPLWPSSTTSSVTVNTVWHSLPLL